MYPGVIHSEGRYSRGHSAPPTEEELAAAKIHQTLVGLVLILGVSRIGRPKPRQMQEIPRVDVDIRRSSLM